MGAASPPRLTGGGGRFRPRAGLRPGGCRPPPPALCPAAPCCPPHRHPTRFPKGCCDCGTRCDGSGLGGRANPSSPPPPRSDPDAAPASFLHLASPAAAGGRGAASREPGRALPAAAAAAPWGRGAGAGGLEPSGGGSPGLAARLQVSTGAWLCNRQRSGSRGRLGKQAEPINKATWARAGGRARSRRLFRQQRAGASGPG